MLLLQGESPVFDRPGYQTEEGARGLDEPVYQCPPIRGRGMGGPPFRGRNGGFRGRGFGHDAKRRRGNF